MRSAEIEIWLRSGAAETLPATRPYRALGGLLHRSSHDEAGPRVIASRDRVEAERGTVSLNQSAPSASLIRLLAETAVPCPPARHGVCVPGTRSLRARGVPGCWHVRAGMPPVGPTSRLLLGLDGPTHYGWLRKPERAGPRAGGFGGAPRETSGRGGFLRRGGEEGMGGDGFDAPQRQWKYPDRGTRDPVPGGDWVRLDSTASVCRLRTKPLTVEGERLIGSRMVRVPG
ncbi:hypothetical protein JHW43_008896 [Diplocarpon mali]|nr:hypothetical protein JHW43_008896 [Diplocarpon mali]